MKRSKKFVLYLSLIVMCMVLLSLGQERGPYLESDSYSYMDIRNIITMPLYVIFLRLHQLAFGMDNYLGAVVISQTLLISVCVVLFVAYLRKSLNLSLPITFLATLLSMMPFCIKLPEHTAAQEILTEALAYPLWYIFALFLLKMIWEKKMTSFVGAFVSAWLLSLTRNQMQLAYGFLALAVVYILCVKCYRKGWLKSWNKKIIGGIGAVILALLICLTGILFTSGTNQGILSFIQFVESNNDTGIQQEETEESTDSKTEETDEGLYQNITTSQFTWAIFWRAIYSADPGDAAYIEDPYVRYFYEKMMDYAVSTGNHESVQPMYLRIWNDILESCGAIGHYVVEIPDEIAAEEIFTEQETVDINVCASIINRVILTHHPWNYIRVTLKLMMGGLVSAIFFSNERFYTLCFIIAYSMFLLSFILLGLGIRWKVDRKYLTLMGMNQTLVVGLVTVTNLIFAGMQRYLIYDFGLFYTAMLLLLVQVGKAWYHSKNRSDKECRRF